MNKTDTDAMDTIEKSKFISVEEPGGGIDGKTADVAGAVRSDKKVDPKRLIIYSEIMHPKFDE